ncbi:unnamed protein product [Didymodactylos carnosus]|uniref:Dual specificity phosphatase catalytic domain-containing protein n=1 Tax=Didymodactylos carnosus TaxID=1234261 RepID=A0A8S2U118_9BILA|nr:unnamed protein product [Didymodactylos carnosus]CAF4318124.1 unnamed protein product [Didymodactylos carnosus]
MRYKQMSLKDAFYFLRARRPIIGPNFGFIKQLIAYEKELYGYTTVRFIETPMGRIPDLYLSSPLPPSRLVRQATMIPIQTKSSMSINAPITSTKQNVLAPKTSVSRPVSAIMRSTNTLPLRSTQSNGYGRNENDFYLTTEAGKIGSSVENEDRHNQVHHHHHHHHHHQHHQPPFLSVTPKNTSNPRYTSSFIKQSPSIYPLGTTSTLPLSKVPSAVNNGSSMLIPTKLNYRTVKYAPSSYNNYRL